MNTLHKKALLGLTALSTVASLAMAETITLDTLIIYSEGSVTEYGIETETRINHLVETTNKIYTDSGLDVKLNPVKIQLYEMDDAATSDTILSAIRKDADVAKIRNNVGADHVIVYRPYANDGACGIAYQNEYLNDPSATWVEKYMYAHVSIDCGGYVTAHEVGHNAGLGHSEAQGSTGAYPYARGHGVQDNFTTVMAYSGVYNGTKIYKHSSPALECNGLPCGIEEGEDKAADAVKALKLTLPLVENFREHVDVPDDNGTDDNGTTDDSAEKLAAALKAYEDQKILFQGLKSERDILKATFKEEKSVYMPIKTEFESKRTVHRAKRVELERLKKISRVVRRAYFRSIYKPSALALKAYRNDVKKPAYTVFKAAHTAYKTFLETTYRPERSKLKKLKKAYIVLKNS